MKKKFISLIVAVFILVASIFLTTSFTKEVDAAETQVTVSLQAVYRMNLNSSEAYPTDGSVKLKVKLSSAATDSITVYYRTLDVTATSCTNDYKSVDTFIIFSKGETEKTIVIEVGKEAFSLKPNGEDYYIGRTFIVEIYKLEGSNCKISSTEGSIRCHTGNDYVYNITESGYIEYLDGSYKTQGLGNSGKIKEGDATLGWNVGLDKKSALQNYYFDNNLAELFVSGKTGIQGSDGLQPDCILHLEIVYQNESGSSSTQTIVQYEIDGPPYKYRTYDFYGYSGGGNVEWNEDTWGYKYDKASKTWSHSGSNGAWGNSEYSLKINGNYWYRAYMSKVSDIRLWFHSDGGYGRRMENAEVGYMVVDDHKPHMIGYYLDEKVYKDDNMLYLRVRYSEPVKIEGSKPSIEACINRSNKQVVTFDYIEGEGTDTLVFGFNLNNTTYDHIINNFSIKQIINATHIYDYSYLKNKCVDCSSSNADGGIPAVYSPDNVGSELTTYVDPRNPIIYQNDIKVDNKIANTHQISVFVQNFEYTTGHLYYSWSNDVTSSSVIQRLDNYASEAKNTNGSFVINTEGLTGVRFLWVKAVSSLGRNTSKLIGPYYFDNHSETVDAITYINNDADQATKTKQISFIVDYSDNYMASSELDIIDIVTAKVDAWKQNTEYLINNGNPKKRFIELAKVSPRLIQYYNSETGAYDNYEVIETKVENSLEFGVKDIAQESTYSKSVFYSKDVSGNYNTTTYNLKVKYTVEVAYSDIGIENNSFDKLYLGIRVTDVLGNTKEAGEYSYSRIRAYFDSRNILKLDEDYKFISPSKEAYNLDGELVYEADGATFTFATESDMSTATWRLKVKKPAFYSLYTKNKDGSLTYDNNTPDDPSDDILIADANGYLTQAEVDKIFNVTLNEGKKFVVSVKDDIENPYGYYSLFLEVEEVDSNLAVSYKGTTEFNFYLTSSALDNNTTNYNNIQETKIVKNKLYQISSDTSFYYMDELGGVNYEKYSEKNNLYFSSKEIAEEYLKFLEYQDLTLVYIDTDQLANDLNQKINGHYKADGEEKTAVVGQYWIRYKKSTWTSSNTSASEWRYYFYPDLSGTIKIGTLSKNLLNAIDDVVANISNSFGSYIYLTSASGLDKNYIPSVNKSQLRPDYLSISESRSKSKFSTSYPYVGDSEVYNSKVTVGSEEYILASTYTLEFSEETIVLIKQYGSISQYEKIDQDSELLLKKCCKYSGIYSIIEFDKFGVRSFNVYIDRDAPTASESFTQYNAKKEKIEKTTTTDSSHTDYSFSAIDFTIEKIVSDIDPYAYVAIFNASNGNLKAAYTRNELGSAGIKLEKGRYYVEICDRSGNYYGITLTLNDSNLNVSVKVADDFSKITVKVNDRSKDDISRYEIYRNNELVTSSFADSQSFKESGLYLVIVEDWFGNSFKEEVEYIRKTPDITWRYNDGSGYQVYQEGKSIGMYIERVGENTYDVFTSSVLELKYLTSIEASIEVLSKDEGVSYTLSNQSLYSTFTFKEMGSCELKVSYSKFPDIYAVYNIILDNKVPEIHISYDQSNYIGIENDYLSDYIKKTVGLTENTLLQPNGISYYLKSTYRRTVINGSKVSSKLLELEVVDQSEITEIEVYLDNVLLKKYTGADPIDPMISYGTYLIYATDKLGNKAIFKFINEEFSDVSASVDGNAVEIPLSCIDYFDLNNVYKKVFYGNESLDVSFSYESEIKILIEAGISTLYFGFSYENGILYPTSYITEFSNDAYQYDESGTQILADKVLVYKVENGTPLLSLESFTKKEFKFGEYIQICFLDEHGADIYATFTEDSKLHFKIIASSFENEEYTIDLRINSDDLSEPVYIKAGLSLIKSDIIIENEDGVIETNKKEKIIYVNGSIELKESNIDRNLISKIRVSYSDKNLFKEFTTIYELGEFTSYYIKDDGFYQIEITNVYSNITKYIIALSNKCMVVTTVTYADESSNVYSNNYQDNYFYSNREVKFDIYTDNVTYEVYKGTNKYGALLVEKDGYLQLVIQEPGFFNIKITDKFGNEFNKNVEISTQTLSISESLIYGYNELALRRLEGYTNNSLSFNKDELMLSSIKYLYIYKDDVLVKVLIDELSENKVLLDSTMLEDAIGSDGDGAYKVVFKDQYGNKAVKTINVRKESTLYISRFTLTSSDNEEISLEDAIKNGIYSNNIVTLFSKSKTYKLLVNKVSKKLNEDNKYNLEFITDTLGEGTMTFEIYYLDDYGNEYNLIVNLIRQDVNFDEVKFNTREFNFMNYTKDNVYLTFNSEYLCTYTIDGSNPIDYTSGTVLNNEGKYVFTIKDRSGNANYYTVTKDTIVDYNFISSKTGQKILGNQVITEGTVALETNSLDNVVILSCFKDGYEQKTDSLVRFSETGKWEFLLEDKVGNKSTFTFYIITHEIARFDYTTPSDYLISEVYKDGGDGVRISYLSKTTNDSSEISLVEDGTYYVTLFSTITSETTSFKVTISTTLPEATLSGVEDGGKTAKVITLNGTKAGDTCYIYKDGKLYNTYNVVNDGDTFEIDEEGYYVIDVVNVAGNKVSYSFTRKFVANTAGSVLVIVLLTGFAIGLFVAIIYRNRTRVDK